MKLISWKFSDMRSTDLAIGNHVLISKGQWDGLLFSISGLGLTKEERDIFDTRFLEMRNVVNFYIGKILISYDRKGIYEHLSSVDITKEIDIKEELTQRVKEDVDWIRNGFHAWQNKRQFKTIYEFELYHSGEGYFSFKTDMLSAFQLARNYEADLYLHGKGLIYSPLRFECDQNCKQVERYLGKRFITPNGGYNLRGNKNSWSYEIKFYRRLR